jgi:hypothetical protein
MQPFLIFSIFFVGAASAGIVNVTRCEGLGTPIQTRITGCDGFCKFQPGKVYDCEQDFMPSKWMVKFEMYQFD